MNISGHTKPFAVLGHPIGHTLSPVMHNAAFRELGWDAIYLAFDVHPDRLMSALPAMGDLGFVGVNLTVPLKEVAFRGLASVDESAALLGAVNTVAFGPSGPTGYNTDGYGFLQALQETFGRTVKGDAVFVLGAGGAGRAVALVAAREGASSVGLCDIDAERVARVADEVRKAAPGAAVNVVRESDRAQAARAAAVVIHATPLGMKPGEGSPLGSDAFREGQRVLDLIYMYPETALTRCAREAGASAVNGLGMLLHQGAKALAIWTNTEPPVEAMRAALEGAVYRS